MTAAPSGVRPEPEYVIPRGRRGLRVRLLRPLCGKLGHRWRPLPGGLGERSQLMPSGHRFRTRGCDRCRRCGLLRWSW